MATKSSAAKLAKFKQQYREKRLKSEPETHLMIQGEEVFIYKGVMRTVDGKKKTCSKCGELLLKEKFGSTKNYNKPTRYYRSACKKCMAKGQANRKSVVKGPVWSLTHSIYGILRRKNLKLPTNTRLLYSNDLIKLTEELIMCHKIAYKK